MEINNLPFLKKKRPDSLGTDSFFSVNDLNYSQQYVDVISKRIIASICANLSYKERFTYLYQNNLVDILYSLFKTGSLKGFLYYEEEQNQENPTEPKKIAKFFSTQFIEVEAHKYVEIDIKQKNTNLYKYIKDMGYLINLSLNTLSNKVSLNSAFLLKLEGARQNFNEDQSANISQKIANSFNNVKSGKSSTLILDAKDKLENISENLLRDSQDSLNIIFDYLSLGTGFPSSFFSGMFSSGLNSTGLQESEMKYDARSTIFNTYFKVFFDYIYEHINVAMNLQDRYSLQELQNLIVIEDRIDEIEIYRQLGLPLKEVIDETKNPNNSKNR